jgi:hypothetical protein
MPWIFNWNHGWVFFHLPQRPARQHILLKKGNGKYRGNGKGKCKVKGKGKEKADERTCIGLDKHGVEVHWSDAVNNTAVEGDIASLQRLTREIADESDSASRELAVALKALNEDRRAHYLEFKWHV